MAKSEIVPLLGCLSSSFDQKMRILQNSRSKNYTKTNKGRDETGLYFRPVKNPNNM